MMIIIKRRDKQEKTSKKRIEKIVRQLLIELGENPDREGLADTPASIAEMYKEIFSGYRMNVGLDVCFSEETNAIAVKDIQFYSICEHHMLPFYGKILIVYIPSGMLADISKLVCLVEKYARRLQIQERLTKQIADELIGMGIRGVSVIVEAEHLCMKMRGVRNDSSIKTVCHRGIMEQKDFRESVLSMTRVSRPKPLSVVA